VRGVKYPGWNNPPPRRNRKTTFSAGYQTQCARNAASAASAATHQNQ